MTPRRALLSIVCAASLVATELAAAKPPITCGRISVAGQPYVMRGHQTPCTNASRWLRTYMRQGTSPRGFRCRNYGASVPAHCVGKRDTNDKPYFFATKP